MSSSNHEHELREIEFQGHISRTICHKRYLISRLHVCRYPVLYNDMLTKNWMEMFSGNVPTDFCRRELFDMLQVYSSSKDIIIVNM